MASVEGIYENRWYLCRFTDRSNIVEPDWSRVPEEKREKLRSGWKNKATGEVTTVNLWGPQIPFFMKDSDYTIEVL